MAQLPRERLAFWAGIFLPRLNDVWGPHLVLARKYDWLPAWAYASAEERAEEGRVSPNPGRSRARLGSAKDFGDI
jgi:hypothetical protein